jgi:predicted nuclease with TOPRIM domain
MSAGNLFADAAALAALASAAFTWFRGWRRRDRDRAVAAATAPFTAGREVAEEAERLLALRGATLQESERREKDLRDRNAELQAQNSAQEKQISELYARLGHLTAENSELHELVNQAKTREESDRRRINELEAKVQELTKHLGLGQ